MVHPTAAQATPMHDGKSVAARTCTHAYMCHDGSSETALGTTIQRPGNAAVHAFQAISVNHEVMHDVLQLAACSASEVS